MHRPGDWVFPRPSLAALLLTTILGVAGLYALWGYTHNTSAYMPSLTEITNALIRFLADDFGRHFSATVSSVATGIAIGAPVGIALGIAPLIVRSVLPLVFTLFVFFGALSKVGMFLVFAVWLGVIGPASKVALIAWVTVIFVGFPVLMHGRELLYGKQGLHAPTNPVMHRLALDGASRWRALCYVVFPRLLPQAVRGLMIPFLLSWSLMPLLEGLGGSAGIGRFVKIGEETGRVDEMFAGMLVLAFCSLVSCGVILTLARILERRWHLG